MHTETISLYRAGAIKNPPAQGTRAELASVFDRLCPSGRQTRNHAVYAAPDMSSIPYWSEFKVQGEPNLEITVDPSKIYVYPVYLYDQFIHAHYRTNVGKNLDVIETIREYWNSGVELSKFKQLHPNLTSPGDYEALVPMEAIISHRELSMGEIMAESSDQHDDYYYDYFDPEY